MTRPFPEEVFNRLLVELAQTPGPSLNEIKRRGVIERFLQGKEIPFEVDAACNVIIQLAPGRWEDTVVFDAHYDVVEEGFCEAVTLTDEHIHGIGTGDDLSAVAMLLLLADQIQTNTLRRPLTILLTTGEEGLGNLKGIRQFVEDWENSPHLFISFDLSYHTYSVSGVGSNRYKASIETQGGHSWNDFPAPNAIEHLTVFISQLCKIYSETAATADAKFTFNLGQISGGSGINSIARNAEVTFEFRSETPALLDQAHSEVLDLVSKFSNPQKVSIACENIGQRPAASPLIPNPAEELALQVFEELGIESSPLPLSTNINMTLSRGWPSICIGLCDLHNTHRHDEYVTRSSLQTGWNILTHCFKKSCGLSACLVVGTRLI